MLGNLVLALMAAVPFLLGNSVVLFLRGSARFLAGAVLLSIFGAVIVFAVSPLPQRLDLTRDPGYDSSSLVPMVMIAAEFGVCFTVLGIVIATLGLAVAKLRK